MSEGWGRSQWDLDGSPAPRCGFAAGRHPPSPHPSREEKAEQLLDSQAEVQGLEAEIRRLRQEVRSNVLPPTSILSPPHRGPIASCYPSPHCPVANPSSTSYGSDPGPVRTSQARRALSRGGRGTEGAGRPPSTPAGRAAALSREASRCRGLQGPAGGEVGSGLEAEYFGGRGLEAGPAGGVWPREE